MTKSKHKEARVLILTGTIRMHARGFGFVIPDKKSEYKEDIFIPKQRTGLAVDGDKVEVEVNSVVSAKGPEGKVLAILERSRTHLAGTIIEISPGGTARAYVPVLGENFPVTITDAKEEGLVLGDRIVIHVTDWGNKGQAATKGTVSHKIGSINDPATDVEAALEEFDIRCEFPAEAVEEAKAYGIHVREEDWHEREDLTGVETITIDPDTAKDFDDALSLKKKRGGGYELLVHVADVSHYVKAGTSLDDEAQKRCNSTYFPGRCVPMLPEELSNNLCSLNPHVPRLAATVQVQINAAGEVTDYKLFRSVIQSAHRFTYKEAKAIIDGKPHTHKPMLDRMVELCHLLKTRRKTRGSVDLAVPDNVILVDKQGNPTGLEVVEYDVSHQLVEEFMLKANEIVATHLSKQKKGLTYRIHDKPDEDSIQEFVRLALAFGYKLSSDPTPAEFQAFFEEIKDTPYYSFMVTHYIRSMKLAIYSPENIGHYGLSLEYYCHFTSPIRRYADLVVHRILFGHETTLQELEVIAAKASEKERVSAKAEGSVTLLKKLRHIAKAFEADPETKFPAIITKIKPFGFVFELIGYELEGFINLSDVESDYYVYSERNETLVGRRTNAVFSIGQTIGVYLKSHDLIIMEAKWGLVETVEKRSHKEKQKTKKKETKRPRRRKKR